MTATRSVLLAGVAGEQLGRHHQRDMYAPALAAATDLEALGLWAPGADPSRVAEVPVATREDLAAALAEADGVVACVDAAGAADLLDLVAERPEIACPIVVDKIATFGTSALAELAALPGAAWIRAAHHWRFHPPVTALAAATAAGEFGLPHALHGELLVPFGDGPAAGGDLRHVGVLALDVVAAVLGAPGRGAGVHAVRTTTGDPASEAWTLSITWQPGVIVTLLIGRGGPEVSTLVHRYRLLASDGQAMADLDGPALHLHGSDVSTIAFGPGPVETMLRSLVGGLPQPDLATTLALSKLMDAAERSASSAQVEPLD